MNGFGSAIMPAPAMTHAAAQELAKIEFLKVFGHAVPASLEEANWLDARVTALKTASGLTQTATTPEGQVVQVHSRMANPSRWPLILAGAAGLGVVGLWFLTNRRTNPQGSRLSPVLVLGGAAAGLWWLGRRAGAQVQAIVHAPVPVEPAPLEGAFD